MPRWVWPIVDANRALKAAIHGSVAKAVTATLRYEAFEARSRSGVRPQCDLMPKAQPKTRDLGWEGMLQTDYATGRPW